MRKLLPVGAVTLSIAMLAAPQMAQAQYCQGTVHGLSGTYNAATGAGFLAVREEPSSSGAKLAELFNGDKVEITGRQGNWYQVMKEGGSDEGWVSVRWMRNSCGY
ncbi:SH3 domain-containing protein [Aestuariivirga litoralis]|uniref:SH3 domain-containing protein n=1 Tax=Aestuariivirga litoralis TaxID=2650924 RepID=UPI0018C5BDE5|nr:SH3 domain-containing protein [Aestuariivirga litoralis]MBG1231753.1 SH3 domain-containing protein [Aestuariivirga litoralis]